MAAQPLAVQVGVAPACQALGVSRATFYRRQRPTPGHQQPRPTPARALCESEREHVLNVLASPRFVDRAPAEVAATLLDEGQYLCSECTMYRILAANQPVRERRNQRDHPQYTKPELVATGPNQTWSWDITKLLGPKKWTYFYLYVVLDIFSRYAVGWMVADRENSALAGRLAAQRIGRRAHTRSPLGMRHHRFERIEFTGQPCSQTVRQQAEGGVALGAVPASDLRPARGLARVGAVACQRTFAVRVIRAAIEPCIAPRLGPNPTSATQP